MLWMGLQRPAIKKRLCIPTLILKAFDASTCDHKAIGGEASQSEWTKRQAPNA